MKRTLIAIGLLASVAMPTLAQAQNADDVLVMRRAVTEPKGKTTIKPSPDFKRVPLEVVDSGTNIYAADGNIGLRIQTVGCLLTSGVVSTNVELCVEGTGPATGDILNFPAKMDPDLLTYFVDRGDYQEFLPQFSAQQIEALCTGSVSIAGETYQGSCDPAAVVNTYAWVASGLEDPSKRSSSFPSDMNPTASAEEINLYVNSIKCKQTDTGAIVDNSNCGAIKKSPAYELRKIPAVMSPEFRKVHVTVADILAAAPDMDQAVANSMCSTWVRIAGITWTMSCDAPKNPAHYVRVAASLLDPDRHYSYSTPNAQYVNGSANADTITLSVYGTKCFDISSGNAVSTDVDNCAYLTSGPSHYDLVTIPATIVAELGTVYVERSELEAVLPYDGKAGNISSQTTTVDGLCAAGYAGFPIAVGPGGSRQGFRFVCGTPEDPSNYARTIGQALDPYEFYPMGNYAVRDTNSNFQGTSYSFSVKSTICTNLATGADGGSKCDFKQDGPNIYDLLSIPASYVPEMREIYVQQSDLTAALGSGAAAYYNSSSQYKTVSQICSTGLERLKVGPSSNRQEWTMLCGDPVDPADFRRSATILGDPNDLFHPFDRTNQTANSDVNASEFKFSVYRTDCVNTRTGETHNPSRCDYLPTGLERYDIVGVPATFVPELREFYVDEAQLRTQLPSLTHIDDANSSGSDLASVCNGSENRFWVTGQNWKMYCGQADDPRRYADVASNLVDPKAEYRDSEYRKLNEDLSSGVYKFGVRTTKCIYKDTGASAPNAKCQYLTQDNAEIYDIVSIPVSYDVANKKIMVTRAALEAAMPHGASASRYDGNYKNVTQICNGELKNLKAGPVAADYWDMVCID